MLILLTCMPSFVSTDTTESPSSFFLSVLHSINCPYTMQAGFISSSQTVSTELSWSIGGKKQGLRERLPRNKGVLLVSNLLAGKSHHFGVLTARSYWTSGFKMVLWCLVMSALRTLCSVPAYATEHKQQTCGFLNALTDIWSVWGGTYELSLWCASSLHPVWKYSSDILQSCMLQWGTLLASSCNPPLCLSRNAHVLQWWSDGDPRRAQFITETFSDICDLGFFQKVKLY